MASHTSRMFLRLRCAASLQGRAANLRSVHPPLRTIQPSHRCFSSQTPTPNETSSDELNASDSRLTEQVEPTAAEPVQDARESVSPDASSEGQTAVDASATIDPGTPKPPLTATPSTKPRKRSKQAQPEITHIEESPRSSSWYRSLNNQITEMRRRKLDNRSPQVIEDTQHQLDRFQNADWLRLMLGHVRAVHAWSGLKNHSVAWGDMTLVPVLQRIVWVRYPDKTLDSDVSANRVTIGHVNNVVYNRWAETSRVNLLQHLSRSLRDRKEKEECLRLLSNRGVGLIMKSIKTEFKFPVTWPDKVTVSHVLVNMPQLDSTSLQFRVYMYSMKHQRLVAKCYEEITIYDYKKAKKTTLPPHLVGLLQDLFKKQVDVGIRTDAFIRAAEDRLRMMEKLPDKPQTENEEADVKEE